MQNVASITQNQIDLEEAGLYMPDAERSYLALLMKHPDLIVEGERLVRKEWLFAGLNNYVYGIMLFIYKSAQTYGWNLNFDPLSMLMVARQISPAYEREFLVKTEGMETVRAIEAFKPHIHSNSFAQVAHQLIDTANRVDIHRKGRAGMLAAQNRQQFADARQIAQGMSGYMTEIAFRGLGTGDDRIMKLSAVEEEFLVKCRINAANPDENLISLYLNHTPYLMDLLGGLRRRGLTICTARPKTGKTTFSGAMAIQAAVNQVVPTLYLDSEMSRTEMYSRSVSNISRLRETDIITGKIHREGTLTAKLERGIELLRDAPFYYMNVAGREPQEIASIIRQFRTQFVGVREYADPLTNRKYYFSNRAMVIYDWLKLGDAGELKNAAEHQLLGFLASTLKDAANVNDLPIFALGQNNREGAKAKKSTDWEDNAEIMVAGSDRLAQFCTALMTLRNLTREEAKQIELAGLREGFEKQEKVDFNSLRFNQAMHLILNRFGPDFRSGIPLYLNRGTAWYQEMAEDASFKLFRSLKAKTTSKDAQATIQTETKDGKAYVTTVLVPAEEVKIKKTDNVF